jgi:hypothetical protein
MSLSEIIQWQGFIYQRLFSDVIEYSIAVKLVTNTISYQQATSICTSDEKELCSSKTICKDGKIPYSGVIPGDHWVPVADSSNEWIQIGKQSIRKQSVNNWGKQMSLVWIV